MTLRQSGCLISGDVSIFNNSEFSNWDFSNNPIENSWFKYVAGGTSRYLQIIDSDTLAGQDEFSRYSTNTILSRKEVTPTPIPPDAVAVPFVVGKDLEEAKAILTEAGFKIMETVVQDSMTSLGIVSSQDPIAGEMLSREKPVRINISGEYINLGSYRDYAHDGECKDYEINAVDGGKYYLKLGNTNAENGIFTWSIWNNDGYYYYFGIELQNQAATTDAYYTSSISGQAWIRVCVDKKWESVFSYTLEIFNINITP